MSIISVICIVSTAEPAEVQQGPASELKVAEGRVAVLTCRVFGAPRPTIIWQKGEQFEDVKDFHDPRITVLDNGDLEIQACIVFSTFHRHTASQYWQ